MSRAGEGLIQDHVGSGRWNQVLSLPVQGPDPTASPRAAQGREGSLEGFPQKEGLAHLPTTISSCSVAFLRRRCHTSMANKVLLLLKMEVSELMRAARITAIIRPRRPGERRGLRGQPPPGATEAAGSSRAQGLGVGVASPQVSILVGVRTAGGLEAGFWIGRATHTRPAQAPPPRLHR